MSFVIRVKELSLRSYGKAYGAKTERDDLGVKEGDSRTVFLLAVAAWRVHGSRQHGRVSV